MGEQRGENKEKTTAVEEVSWEVIKEESIAKWRERKSSGGIIDAGRATACRKLPPIM